MRKTLLAAPLGAVITLALVGIAFAHGGGLDANGGHVDHSTGQYHYHRQPAPTPAPAATASTRGTFSPGTDAYEQYLKAQRAKAPASAAETPPGGAALVAASQRSDVRREALIALMIRKGVFTQAEFDAELARQWGR